MIKHFALSCRGRRFLAPVIKAVISACLLYISMRNVDFSTVISRLRQASPMWILAAIGIMAGATWLSALRWRLVSIQSGIEIDRRRSIRYILIGMFFNQTLPSAIGGDAVRIWLVGRYSGKHLISAYSVLIDRAIGMMTLALLVLACLPWSLQLIVAPEARFALLIVIAGSIGASIFFLLLSYFPRTSIDTWFLVSKARACSDLANRMLFHGQKKLWLIAVSFAIHILGVGVTWAAAKSIGANVGFTQLLLLVPPILLILVLPISMAGWGVRESAMLTAFQYASLPPSEGVFISLLFGAILLIVGVAGGAAWILDSRSNSRKRLNP